MGLEHLNAGFLLHVLNEQSEFNELNTPGIRSSMDRWWANCVRDREERHAIRRLIRRVRSGDDDFVFTREMYERYIAERGGAGSQGGRAVADERAEEEEERSGVAETLEGK